MFRRIREWFKNSQQRTKAQNDLAYYKDFKNMNLSASTVDQLPYSQLEITHTLEACDRRIQEVITSGIANYQDAKAEMTNDLINERENNEQ